MFFTNIVRFVHCDSSEIEEQGFTTREEAWEVFSLFAEEDSADIYSRVELLDILPGTQERRLIASLLFPAQG